MLRQNIDTKAGLVNGAIGTVVAISATQITIKFDHATDPYKIERVKSAFMVMKKYYVYHTQFPLILAYAVTIHKCQPYAKKCACNMHLTDNNNEQGNMHVKQML